MTEGVRRQRRKVSAVVTGTAFSGKTTGTLAATKLSVGTVVFDPLETIATSGTVKFTAPYSRFYRIEVISPFVSLGYANPVDIFSDALGNPTEGSITEISDRVSVHTVRMYKNGVLIATPSSQGGVYTASGLIAKYTIERRAYGGPVTFTIDTNSTGFGESRCVFTTWLESGDFLEFDYIGEVLGFNTTETTLIAWDNTTIPATPAEAGAFVATTLAGNYNVSSYSYRVNRSAVQGIKVADPIVAADYYIEINELDRD